MSNRPLGPSQLGVIQGLRSHGYWADNGCGWTWGSISETKRILNSLVKRGIVTTDGRSYRLADEVQAQETEQGSPRYLLERFNHAWGGWVPITTAFNDDSPASFVDKSDAITAAEGYSSSYHVRVTCDGETVYRRRGLRGQPAGGW